MRHLGTETQQTNKQKETQRYRTENGGCQGEDVGRIEYRGSNTTVKYFKTLIFRAVLDFQQN